MSLLKLSTEVALIAAFTIYCIKTAKPTHNADEMILKITVAIN